MSRKINSLLVELAVADPQTSAFLDISKKIVETYRLIQKEKSEKIPKEPKTPKPKEPKEKTKCNNCEQLQNINDKCYSLIDSITDDIHRFNKQ